MILMFTDNEVYLVILDVTFYFFLQNVYKETLQSSLFFYCDQRIDRRNPNFCVIIDEVKKNTQKQQRNKKI